MADPPAWKASVQKSLSPRELECVKLVPELRTTKAIAARLQLQPDTVDGYLKSALRKLGVTSRYDAALLIIRSEQPHATPLFGVPQAAGVEAQRPFHPTSITYGAEPSVPSDLKEDAVTFDHMPVGARSRSLRLLGMLVRREGGRNELSGWHRLMLSLFVTAAGVIVLFLLTAALLALALVYREVGRS